MVDKANLTQTNLNGLNLVLQVDYLCLLISLASSKDRCANSRGAVCKIVCQYGQALDENGCPDCRCNPKPGELLIDSELPGTFENAIAGSLCYLQATHVKGTS